MKKTLGNINNHNGLFQTPVCCAKCPENGIIQERSSLLGLTSKHSMDYVLLVVYGFHGDHRADPPMHTDSGWRGLGSLRRTVPCCDTPEGFLKVKPRLCVSYSGLFK